jgi:hypothetical protein
MRGIAMKNKLMLLGLALALGGAALGIHYRIRIVIALVCVGLAIFSAVSGFQMVVTRKAVIPTSEGASAHREYHTGISAQFWGVLFLIFSVPAGAFGVLYWMYGDNPPAEIIERMARSPLISGLIMITVGVGIGLYGLTRVLPGKAAFAETKIGPFERGLTAVYSSTVGALVVAAGLVRMLAPGTLTRMRDGAIAWTLALIKSP